MWILDDVTGRPDYSPTIRSTFPDWSKFFYEKADKRTKKSLEWLQTEEKWKLGWFQGNTRELIKILEKVKAGKRLTPRQAQAVEILFNGIRDEEEEFRYLYNEELFDTSHNVVIEPEDDEIPF